MGQLCLSEGMLQGAAQAICQQHLRGAHKLSVLAMVALHLIA